MECEGFEAEVVALLYGELPPAQKAEAEAHAASCETCGKLSRELGEARSAASSLPRRETPPRELDERIALAARFAAESRDVRSQPLRGGGLHVAAAAVLLGIISVSAFGLGTWVNRPKRHLDDPPVEPWETTDRTPAPRPSSPQIEIRRSPGASPEPEEDHSNDRDDPKRQQQYNERLLKLARDELQAKQPEKALVMLDALVGKANGSRLPWVLETRLERARALFSLGKIDDARREARAVHEAILSEHFGDPALKPLDDASQNLLEDLNKVR